MAAGRDGILDELATRIVNLLPRRVVRVAVDGRTASGKTTLSNEIAEIVRSKDRPVIRTSIDGFHRPKIERYARGRHSAEGYYYDARDLSAVNKLLLTPLGPNGDRLYRTESFDLETDRPIEQKPLRAPSNAVVIVDGTFLQRPQLRDNWDLTIFVATSDTVSIERGVKRDANRVGGRDAAFELFTKRYRPGLRFVRKFMRTRRNCRCCPRQ